MDHKVDFGVYLTDRKEGAETGDACVLLPRRQVPAGLKKGDPVEVFLYRDSRDRMIATVNFPKLTLGELAVLTVSEVNRVGAFLDWGLEKDLLLPYSEQVVEVKKGERYLVALYIDRSERLCATMRIYDFLRSDAPYAVNDTVRGTVFEKNPQYGVFVAVDNRYLGMLQKKEVVRGLRIGDEIEVRVIGVREDGKLNLSMREKGYIQMDIDSKKILEQLEEAGGFLPYHDKSAPDDIRAAFGMSKNEFKRAIGRLYKNKQIALSDQGIRLQK